MEHAIATLSKRERLHSRALIERLFDSGGSKSMSAFPLRVVYMTLPYNAKEPLLQIMVSVSKRRFKLAVQRNRARRQVKEAYRRNKWTLLDVLKDANQMAMVLAFIWQSDKILATKDVEQAMKSLLSRLIDKVKEL